MRLADVKKLIYAYLRSQPAFVQALTIGGKLQVFGPPGLPETWTLRKTVEYRRQHGRPGLDLPIDYATFQFRCYGATPQEAETVFAALLPVLHGQGMVTISAGADQGVLQFSRVTGYDDGQEPEPLNWPYVLVLADMHWIRHLRD